MDYPSLNLQSSEAVLLIESINNFQFIPMIFSLIERIFTLLFRYFTIYFLANCKDIMKALFISITIHSVFNIIGIFFINYVNSCIGRIIFLYWFSVICLILDESFIITIVFLLGRIRISVAKLSMLILFFLSIDLLILRIW